MNETKRNEGKGREEQNGKNKQKYINNNYRQTSVTNCINYVCNIKAHSKFDYWKWTMELLTFSIWKVTHTRTHRDTNKNTHTRSSRLDIYTQYWTNLKMNCTSSIYFKCVRVCVCATTTTTARDVVCVCVFIFHQDKNLQATLMIRLSSMISLGNHGFDARHTSSASSFSGATVSVTMLIVLFPP